MSKKWWKISGLVAGLAAISFFSFFHFRETPPLLNKTEVLAQFFKLPIYFEKNEGQTDPSVKYLTRGKKFTAFFTPQEIVMVLDRNENASVIKLQFLGANEALALKGSDELEGKSNYFLGNDPEKWRTNISQFGKVCYQDLYKGIDAVFYGNPFQLEYDLCVAPGIDPQEIRFQLQGAKELSIDEEGNLCILTETIQEMQMQKPLIYQLINNEKVLVDGGYTLLATNEVGFAIGAYDTTTQLIIDPLVYSTYLGGSSSDTTTGIAIDSSGNAYVTGYTPSTNFPIVAGSYDPTYPGGALASFITKLNPTGTALIYSTYLGGTNGTSQTVGIALDGSDNAYVTGKTTSTTFPTTSGAFQSMREGPQASFISKLNSSGATLTYSTYFGSTAGSGSVLAFCIAVDATEKAYIAGNCLTATLPFTPGAYDTTSRSGGGFVTIIDTTAVMPSLALKYSTYLGGTNQTGHITGIAIDSTTPVANVYVVGQTNSTTFPTTAGAYQGAYPTGSQAAFISKLNPIGGGTSDLVNSTYFGGSTALKSVNPTGIAVDSSGNAYITGFTNQPTLPTTPGAYATTYPGGTQNVFISKMTLPSGGASSLAYSTYLGGSSQDGATGIVLDSSDNAYVTGFTSSANFPTTAGAIQTTLASDATNAFVSQLNPTNPASSALVYSTFLGGSVDDEAAGIAIDASNNIYIAGIAFSPDFPTTSGAFQTSLAGTSNAFISKLSTPSSTVSLLPPSVLKGQQINNRFATQSELVNVIKLAPPTSGTTPTSYRIYRDAALTILAGTLPTPKGSLVFKDHNRQKNVVYTYYIISVSSTGAVSTPVVVSVTPT